MCLIFVVRGIRQNFFTPNFSQTTVCEEHSVKKEKEWDEGVHLVLFAAREAIQESLGFSLGFGRFICGSLKLLKEQWLQEETTTNLLDYVSNLYFLSLHNKVTQNR